MSIIIRNLRGPEKSPAWGDWDYCGYCDVNILGPNGIEYGLATAVSASSLLLALIATFHNVFLGVERIKFSFDGANELEIIAINGIAKYNANFIEGEPVFDLNVLSGAITQLQHHVSNFQYIDFNDLRKLKSAYDAIRCKNGYIFVTETFDGRV